MLGDKIAEGVGGGGTGRWVERAGGENAAGWIGRRACQRDTWGGRCVLGDKLRELEVGAQMGYLVGDNVGTRAWQCGHGRGPLHAVAVGAQGGGINGRRGAHTGTGGNWGQRG